MERQARLSIFGALRTLTATGNFHREGIDLIFGGDEKCFSIGPAKRDIRGRDWKRNITDHAFVWSVNANQRLLHGGIEIATAINGKTVATYLSKRRSIAEHTRSENWIDKRDVSIAVSDVEHFSIGDAAMPFGRLNPSATRRIVFRSGEIQ